MNLNKVILFGCLTKDPESKTTGSGNPISSFSIATNRSWKDQSGTRQEQVEYHNITTFGTVAQSCAKFLVKGQQVLIEGRMQTNSYEKNGVKSYFTEVVADSVQFGQKAHNANKLTGDAAEQNKALIESEKQKREKMLSEGEVDPEDIPF